MTEKGAAAESTNHRKKGRRGGRPVSHDAELHKDRNTVERCINKFKEWRRLATRCDKTPTATLPGSTCTDPSSGCAASQPPRDLNYKQALDRMGNHPNWDLTAGDTAVALIARSPLLEIPPPPPRLTRS